MFPMLLFMLACNSTSALSRYPGPAGAAVGTLDVEWHDLHEVGWFTSGDDPSPLEAVVAAQYLYILDTRDQLVIIGIDDMTLVDKQVLQESGHLVSVAGKAYFLGRSGAVSVVQPKRAPETIAMLPAAAHWAGGTGVNGELTVAMRAGDQQTLLRVRDGKTLAIPNDSEDWTSLPDGGLVMAVDRGEWGVEELAFVDPDLASISRTSFDDLLLKVGTADSYVRTPGFDARMNSDSCLGLIDPRHRAHFAANNEIAILRSSEIDGGADIVVLSADCATSVNLATFELADHWSRKVSEPPFYAFQRTPISWIFLTPRDGIVVLHCAGDCLHNLPSP